MVTLLLINTADVSIARDMILREGERETKGIPFSQRQSGLLLLPESL